MANLHPYRIDYSHAVFNLPVEELLDRTMPDVTPNHAEATMYATAAFDRMGLPIEQEAGHPPSTASLAAVAAGYRGQQSGMPTPGVIAWFDAAREVFAGERGASQLELAGILITEGRALGARAIKEDLADEADPMVIERASEAFREARGLILGQHKIGHRQHPLAVECDLSAAIHEARSGDRAQGTLLALFGIGKAGRALPAYGYEPAIDADRAASQRRAELASNVGRGAIALALAATRPLTTRSSRFNGLHATKAYRSLMSV